MTYLEELTNIQPKRPENMAAAITPMILQIRKEHIKQSLCDLETVKHRQDYVGTINGVMYYDDSKAESVNATWFTFGSIVNPVVWITGGDDKKCDFSELQPLVRKSVRAMICVGKNNKNLRNAFQKVAGKIYRAENMEEAVHLASSLAHENDIVLYSPACKSENTKESYIERGNQFIASVKQLEQ